MSTIEDQFQQLEGIVDEALGVMREQVFHLSRENERLRMDSVALNDVGRAVFAPGGPEARPWAVRVSREEIVRAVEDAVQARVRERERQVECEAESVVEEEREKPPSPVESMEKALAAFRQAVREFAEGRRLETVQGVDEQAI